MRSYELVSSEPTRKVTVRFSKRLKKEMQEALIKSGYGLRGKSRWVQESVRLLLKQPNYIEYVEHGIDINQAELTEVEAFYLEPQTIQAMKAAFVQIRLVQPLFEGVQSALIRSAIVYSLMIK